MYYNICIHVKHFAVYNIHYTTHISFIFTSSICNSHYHVLKFSSCAFNIHRHIFLNRCCLHYTTLRSAALNSTVPFHATPYRTIPYRSVLYYHNDHCHRHCYRCHHHNHHRHHHHHHYHNTHTIQCDAMPPYTLPCCSTLHCAVQCYAMLWHDKTLFYLTHRIMLHNLLYYKVHTV